MQDAKRLDLEQTVYEICKAYPEMTALLAELGFTDITKPGVLQTVGRVMTIPKGARMKGMAMEEIMEKLRARGFDPFGGGEP